MDAHHTPVIALVLLTAVLYLPIRTAGYVFEDANWYGQQIASVVPGRGLSLWTLSLTTNPQPAHAINVGLHLVNGLLVGMIATTIANPIVATIATGVMLLHPLNTSAVSYLTARADLLVTLFILLAIFASLTGRWLIGVGACLLAMASKELGVIAMPIALLTAWMYRPSPALRMWTIVVGLVCLALLPVVYAWLTMRAGYGGSSWSYLTFLEFQLRAIGRVLALMIIPVGFTIDHDPLALSAWWGIGLLMSGVLLALCARHSRLACWTLASLVCVLLPRVLVSSTEYVQEWHAYLVVAVTAIGLSAGLVQAVKESPCR